jgi:hypothetical protein
MSDLDDFKAQIANRVRLAAERYKSDAEAADTDNGYKLNAFAAIVLLDLAAQIEQLPTKESST